MRVPLSIPDKLFKEAEAAAKQMNVSRSGLYATALAEYLKKLEVDAGIDKLNEAYSRADSRADEALNRAQLEVLARNRS